MEYEYLDDKENCWYKDVCSLRNGSKCSTFCIRHYKMDYLISNSLLGKKDRFPTVLFPDADGTDLKEFTELKNIAQNIKQFVNDGKNLVLYSKTTGNGKTAWAKKLLLNYFNNIWYSTDFKCRGLFVDLQVFFNKLRENINKPNEYIQHIQENILEADLVIWDEIGVKNVTDWEHGYLLSFLNARLDAGKANIFTSNLAESDLRDKLGDRLYSRIILNSKVIEFKGKDKRLANKW